MSVSAAAAATFLPDSTEPVMRDHADVLVADERLAGRARAGDDVEHALGEELGGDLGERSVVSGVVSAGLRTIVLPPASAGPIFQIAIISG